MIEKFIEALPATKTHKNPGIEWTPAFPTGPLTGRLVIWGDRKKAVYQVCEFTTPWDGRAFRLDVVAGGTDGYDVFCHRGRQDNRCECKGFVRFGHCKHVNACFALIENESLWRSQLVNPEADHANTEAHDQPEPAPARGPEWFRKVSAEFA